ncbi:hypothetical protein STSR3_39 [Salmonella virus STSR3]|nr:hypothetical protein STSR3_39 [Salmonella virus STSR3]
MRIAKVRRLKSGNSVEQKTTGARRAHRAKGQTKATNHSDRSPCADFGMWSDELGFAGNLFFHLAQQSFLLLYTKQSTSIENAQNRTKRTRMSTID